MKYFSYGLSNGKERGNSFYVNDNLLKSFKTYRIRMTSLTKINISSVVVKIIKTTETVKSL